MRPPPSVLPPDDSSNGYQPTFGDRHGGADAPVRLRAAVYGVVVFTLSTVVALLKGMPFHLVAFPSMLAGYLTYRGALFVAERAGRAILAFVAPSGDHTPYEDQYSQVDALEARGDVTGALEAYEAIIAAQPTAVAPRTRAAELYAARGANPRRAAELFLEVRSLPGVSRRDALYACSRLVDLYDGPLDEPGRALVELRRIIELYPGTPVATHARDALPRLKARLADSPDPG